MKFLLVKKSYPMDIYEFPDVRHDKRDNDSKFNGLITRNNPKSAGLQKIQSLFGFFFLQ